MSFVGNANRGVRLRHQETIAADALADLIPASPGLGFAPIAGATAVAKAAPAIIDIIKRFGGGVSVGDRAQEIWKSLPPEAIGARVGAGGWWYDIEDGHQLSHEEAANRQREVAAAAIGARVGPDGWWYDNQTGIQLTYQDAIDRYERLTVVGPSSSGTLPQTFRPSNAFPLGTEMSARVPSAPMQTAGLTPAAMVIGLGVLVGLAVAMRKGRR